MRELTPLTRARIPATVKSGLRVLAPRWVYRMVGRAVAGQPLFQPGVVLPFEDHRVRHLDQKLWQGFANDAVADLEALRVDRGVRRWRAGEAALALCRYYAVNGKFDQALECLHRARNARRSLGRGKRWQLIEVFSLLALDRTADARQVAERLPRRGAADAGCRDAALASVGIAAARRGVLSADDATKQYLACVNRPLERAGFVGLALRDANKTLGLDNLAPATSLPTVDSASAKVSVLMAVYNGADNIEWAMRSVLEQSWRNLEVVVVDDASSDDSWSVIQRLAAGDERIVPIRQRVNGGAYVARNAALARATGDYVVVNDADDWAHPQKIEVQVRGLLKADSALANWTDLIRVTRDMIAQPQLGSPYVPLVHRHYASLMLPRRVVLDMGGWDSARVSADSELAGRVRALYGSSAIGRVHPGQPLSFALVAESNLTAAGATGARSFYFGSRQAYALQFREWHQSGADLRTRRTSQVSPFPLPGICYRAAGHEQRFDVVLVSNFDALDDASSGDVAYLRQLREQGLEVAIMIWPCYESAVRPGAGVATARLCRELGVVTVVHGEKVHCDLLVVARPRALMHELDRVPEIVAGRIVVVAETEPDSESGGKNNRKTVQQVVSKAFGRAGAWVPRDEWMESL